MISEAVADPSGVFSLWRLFHSGDVSWHVFLFRILNYFDFVVKICELLCSQEV